LSPDCPIRRSIKETSFKTFVYFSFLFTFVVASFSSSLNMIPQRYFLTIVFAALIASGNSARERMSESLLHGPGKEEPTPMEDRNLGAVPSSSCPHLKAFFQEDLHHHDLIRSHFEDLMNSAYIGLSRQDNDRAFAKYMDFIKQSCHAGDESSGRRRLLPTEEEVSQEERTFEIKRPHCGEFHLIRPTTMYRRITCTTIYTGN
jgi:hypothetical protein